MNNFEQYLLNELSKKLYQRAADKARSKQKGASLMSKGHSQLGFQQGEHGKAMKQHHKRKGTSMEDELSLTNMPNIVLSKKYEDLDTDREAQVGKFSAGAKGVKTRREPRGYPLGEKEKTLGKQSQIQLDKARRKNDERKKRQQNDDDNDPADDWKNESIFEQHLINVLLEVAANERSPNYRTPPGADLQCPGCKQMGSDTPENKTKSSELVNKTFQTNKEFKETSKNLKASHGVQAYFCPDCSDELIKRAKKRRDS